MSPLHAPVLSYNAVSGTYALLDHTQQIWHSGCTKCSDYERPVHHCLDAPGHMLEMCGHELVVAPTSQPFLQSKALINYPMYLAAIGRDFQPNGKQRYGQELGRVAVNSHTLGWCAGRCRV